MAAEKLEELTINQLKKKEKVANKSYNSFTNNLFGLLYRVDHNKTYINRRYYSTISSCAN
jgi:hypothetical protein